MMQYLQAGAGLVEVEHQVFEAGEQALLAR